MQTEFSLWYAFKRVSCFLIVLEWHIPGVSQNGFEMVFCVSRWYIWRIFIATRGVGTNSSIVSYAEELISQQFFLKVLSISLRLNESALPHVNLSPRRVINIKFRGLTPMPMLTLMTTSYLNYIHGRSMFPVSFCHCSAKVLNYTASCIQANLKHPQHSLLWLIALKCNSVFIFI